MPTPRSRQTRRLPAKRAPVRPQAIVNLAHVTHSPFYNWLVYGQSGVGKSVLQGSHGGLILTTEASGSISAKAMGSKADELPIESWTEYLEYVRWLEAAGHKEYEWIGLDSLDELEEHAWHAIMNKGGAARNMGGGFRSRSRNDYPLVWAAMAEQVERLVRLQTNVLITSKVMRIDTETEDGDTTTLALPLVGSTKRGDMAMKVAGKMTLVGYYRKVRTETESGKIVVRRRLFTEDDERWIAKDRHDTFGRSITAPAVPAMVAAITARMASGQRTTRKRSASGNRAA